MLNCSFDFAKFEAVRLCKLPVFSRPWPMKFYRFISQPSIMRDKEQRIIFTESDLQKFLACPRSTANIKIRELLQGNIIIRHPYKYSYFTLNAVVFELQ